MAFDGAGNLYVSAYGFAGGSVLRIDPERREARIFASDLGVVNYLVLTEDRSTLWVSDYRKPGRVLRFRLDQPLPARPDLAVGGLEYPNGLALGRDDSSLYAAETYRGTVARISLGAGQPAVERLIDLKRAVAVGSLDGLAFDPRDRARRFLYVAENMRGMFTVLDVDARPARVVKRLGLALMGGRPCPASMVIRDGSLYFTDLWSCSPIRLLLRMPDFRHSAFRFKVTDLGALY
jgi:sugar lactone lactonase YvrE